MIGAAIIMLTANSLVARTGPSDRNVGWNVARRGRMCGRRVATLGLSSGRTIEDRSVIGAIVGRSTVRRSATRAMTGVTTGSPGPTGAKAGRTIVRHPAIGGTLGRRSEEHTSELQSLMRISYAVFCLKKKKNNTQRDEN